MAALKFAVGQAIYVVEITGRGARRRVRVVPCVYLGSGERDRYDGCALTAEGDELFFDLPFAFEGEKQATLVATKWTQARLEKITSQNTPAPRKGATIKA